jgi:hypothetical protein
VAIINYTPPPTIRDFIRHFEPAELFFDWAIGPVGSGKTTGLFFKLCRMAALQEKSPLDGIRRTRAVIVRNTMPQLKDTTLTSWNYWFKDGQAGSWRATDNKFTLRFGDVECEVLFRGLDTADDVARVLSMEITFAILDEFVQIDEKIVEALSARCGRYPAKNDGGATNWGMWGASNPGNEDDWWFDYLFEKKPANVQLYLQPSGFSPDAENVENLPGGVKYYQSLTIGKSLHWVKQYIEGVWGFSLSGKPVVPTFNSQIHVSTVPLKPNIYLPLVVGFDPGVGGSAMILGQMDLDGRLLVLAELIQEDYGTNRLCSDRLKPLLRTRFSDYEVIIAPDPAADQRATSDEKSSVDVLRQQGFTVKFPDMNNQLGVRLEAIEHFTTRLTARGPALLIDPSCKGLIRALNGGWRYEVLVKKDIRKVEPQKNHHSHPGDGFSYLARYFEHSVVREARRNARNIAVPARYPVNQYAFR